MNKTTLEKNELVKGVNQELLTQDFYRAVTTKDGFVIFNPVAIVNLTFVKFDGNDKCYVFNNPSDTRLKKGDRVLVDTAMGNNQATVVSSIKLPKKYLKDFMEAFTGQKRPLRDVLGIYNTRIVVEEEFTKFEGAIDEEDR